MFGKITKALFSASKPKAQQHQYSFVQTLRYINQIKPYIIPFIHKDKQITRTLLQSYGLLTLSKICFFGGPFLLKIGINSLGVPTAGYTSLLYFFGFGACYSGSVIFQQMRNLHTLKLINAALVETATKAYKHMLSLGPQFYFSGSQRHILFNLYKAQSALQQNLKSFTQYFIPILLDVSLSITLLLYYSNPLFALSFTTCVAAYCIFTVKYSEFRIKTIREFRNTQKRIDFVTSETFSNYYNIKYFQQEEAELRKYHQALQKYYQKNYEVHRTLGILNSVQRGIFGAGLTFNMMLAAYYTKLGLLTIGDIMLIQSLMLQFLSPLFFLGSMYRSFNDNLIDIQKINSIMKTPALVKEGEKELGQVKGQIQFRNVSFRYINEANNIFQGLNFKIQPNSFTAIVGRSGIGKTSILNLVYRLYDPNSGEILLDGVNLREINFNFRNKVSFISQTPYLFSGTVMQNLKFGSHHSSSEEVIELTKRLRLHDTIMQLPQKYETNVGEKGNIFSGGEKQRISIIRALLRKSKILLLDEPTSALDMDSETAVTTLLSELKNTTRILITHRFKILQHCDKVITVG